MFSLKRVGPWARIWHTQIGIEGRRLWFVYRRGPTDVTACVDLREDVTPLEVKRFLVLAVCGTDASSLPDLLAFSRRTKDPQKARRLLRFLTRPTERL